MTLSSLDIFAGAGGLTAGLSRAGVIARFAVEQDPTFAWTFRVAHIQTVVLTKRVQGVEDLDCFDNMDLLVGGPPCQPFSVHGKQQGAADGRDCVPLFIKALETILPPSFIMENVANLAAPRHRDYLTARLMEMASLGYAIHWRVLDAADYGVPQHRRRLFVVGFREHLGKRWRPFEWPEPTHGPGLIPYVTVQEALLSLLPNRLEDPNTSRVVYAKNPVWRPKLINSLLVNGKGRVLDFDAPAPTVTAQSSGNGGHILDMEDTLYGYHNHLTACVKVGVVPVLRTGEVKGARRITWREAARLQGFPDDYPFQGSVSSKFAQIGNAVPPPLAEAIGRAVVKHLEG